MEILNPTYQPIKIKLPIDGYHRGVLWAGLASDWKHEVEARIEDGKFISSRWVGFLINSSSN